MDGSGPLLTLTVEGQDSYFSSCSVQSALPKKLAAVNASDKISTDYQYHDGTNNHNQPITAETARSKAGDLTVKKGIAINHGILTNWLLQSGDNTIESKTVVVTMMGPNGTPYMRWIAIEAFPRKFSVPIEMEGANGPRVSIDEIVFAANEVQIERF